MAKHIVIATHALLAKGIKEALTFLTGLEENIHTICAFTESSEPQVKLDELFDSFSLEDTIIVFTDLYGGSVNQMCAQKLQKQKFYLITGVNLGLVVELALCEENEISEEKIREVTEASKAQIVYMNDEIKRFTESTDEESFF